MRRTTKTKTISLDPDVEKKGIKLAKKRGFKNSFSAYIAKLIEDDARALNGGEIHIPAPQREIQVPA
jgi:predicted CopG family antitoxin